MKTGPATRLVFDTKKQKEKIYRASKLRHWTATRLILIAAESKADAILAEHETQQAILRETQQQAVNQ